MRIPSQTPKYWTFIIILCSCVTNFVMLAHYLLEWVEIKGDWHIKGRLLYITYFNGENLSKTWKDFYDDECEGLTRSHFKICDKIEKIWEIGLLFVIFHLISWALIASWSIRFIITNLYPWHINRFTKTWNTIITISWVTHWTVLLIWIFYIKAGLFGGCDWRFGDSQPNLCYKAGIGLGLSASILILIFILMFAIYSTDKIQQKIQNLDQLELKTSIGLELGLNEDDINIKSIEKTIRLEPGLNYF